MHTSDPKHENMPLRLCSEIQLFDLCDLVSCKHKHERFCNDPVLLGRFEKIAENELRVPERYISEDTDGFEVDDGDGYGDDEFEVDSSGDRDDDWEDEEKSN